MKPIIYAVLLLTMLGGCDEGGSSDDSGTTIIEIDPDTPPVTNTNVYRPPVLVTWQWQLEGEINTSYPVEIYDIDLFDSSQSQIRQLQESGKKLICYFSGGSYEEWRPDADQFPGNALGSTLDGWEGERWLDIRSDAIRTIMVSRLDLAIQKGCDGVEPDNMDGYTNSPGFDLTSSDQLAYNRFIANEARVRGLSVGLKNDLDQIGQLVEYFDFAVNEQCFEFDECDLLAPFINSGKPVLSAEYKQVYVNDTGTRQALCTDSVERQFSTLILPLDLDDTFRFSCL